MDGGYEAVRGSALRLCTSTYVYDTDGVGMVFELLLTAHCRCCVGSLFGGYTYICSGGCTPTRRGSPAQFAGEFSPSGSDLLLHNRSVAPARFRDGGLPSEMARRAEIPYYPHTVRTYRVSVRWCLGGREAVDMPKWSRVERGGRRGIFP